MCVFRITNDPESFQVGYDGFPLLFAKGGPDASDQVTVDGVTFSHRLLHMTGQMTPQPYQTDRYVTILIGEIYNYDRLYDSEVKYITELYSRIGNDFTNELDGEFFIAIYDKHDRVLRMFLDPWATRSCWHTVKGDSWCLSTKRIDQTSFRLKPNTLYELYDGGRMNAVCILHQWRFNQNEQVYTRWTQAFEDAVEKRVVDGSEIPGLLLSCGYDSSAIGIALHNCGYSFDAITHVKTLDLEDARVCNTLISRTGASHILVDGTVQDMASAIESRVMLTGAGADEIFNYDTKINSQMVWPYNLEEFFPWKYFYWDVFEDALQALEIQMLRASVQGRHPFLDKKLTQAFFNLSPDLKNTRGKAPIANYLLENDIPLPRKQIGFTNYVGAK
jgi:asparagine synthetase B (glutamine-hydrolysing)